MGLKSLGSLGYGEPFCNPESVGALYRVTPSSRDILIILPTKVQHSTFPQLAVLAAKTFLQRDAPP